jgi:hypothetical protein
MNPSLAKKAAACVVVPNGKAFRVGGSTAVYDIYPDMISGELRCSCQALKRCSHLLAVAHYQQKGTNK